MSTSAISLSVVVPCFNEAATLQVCIEKVLELRDHGVVLEIIIVDDASSDRSPEIAQGLAQVASEIKVVRHKSTGARGLLFGRASVSHRRFRWRSGCRPRIRTARIPGTSCPTARDEADVVYGSRFLRAAAGSCTFGTPGKKVLTFLSNMLTDLNFTDMETCYKVFRREVIQ